MLGDENNEALQDVTLCLAVARVIGLFAEAIVAWHRSLAESCSRMEAMSPSEMALTKGGAIRQAVVSPFSTVVCGQTGDAPGPDAGSASGLIRFHSYRLSASTSAFTAAMNSCRA